MVHCNLNATAHQEMLKKLEKPLYDAGIHPGSGRIFNYNCTKFTRWSKALNMRRNHACEKTSWVWSVFTEKYVRMFGFNNTFSDGCRLFFFRQRTLKWSLSILPDTDFSSCLKCRTHFHDFPYGNQGLSGIRMIKIGVVFLTDCLIAFKSCVTLTHQ